MANIPAVLKHSSGSVLYGVIIGSGPAAGRVAVRHTQETVVRELSLSYETASAYMGYGKADIRSAGYVLTPLTRID